jgi:hypothetical protein
MPTLRPSPYPYALPVSTVEEIAGGSRRPCGGIGNYTEAESEVIEQAVAAANAVHPHAVQLNNRILTPAGTLSLDPQPAPAIDDRKLADACAPHLAKFETRNPHMLFARIFEKTVRENFALFYRGR